MDCNTVTFKTCQKITSQGSKALMLMQYTNNIVISRFAPKLPFVNKQMLLHENYLILKVWLQNCSTLLS